MFRQILFFSFIIVLLLTACGGAQTSLPSAEPAEVDEHPPTDVPEAEEGTADEQASETDEAKVTLYHKQGAQFELVSPEGTRALIDVANPGGLTSPPTEADVLLTTHSHQDHVSTDFRKSFPGQQLNVEEGEINLADVKCQRDKICAHGL